MQTTKSTSGCGCGGGSSGGSVSTGGCGCKPAKLPEAVVAACSPCETASFVRPRFFAGQLLTEDDLGALIDYVVTKNRFHNARLFGAGVVCGLLAECGPCDSSQIVVQPGFALDCCGNDLVLTCEKTLDIAPMIRELAARKGAGCTEPCPPPSTSLSTSSEASKKPAEIKQYFLYARYAERADQPVAAYPVGEDCDAASCEPTRIVEGIVFELRCDAGTRPKTVDEAMKECAARIDPKADYSARAVDYQWLSSRLASSFERPAAAFDVDEARLLAEAGQDYDKLFRGLTGAERIAALTRFIPESYGRTLRHTLLKAALPEGSDIEKINANAKRAVAELSDVNLESLPAFNAELARSVLHTYELASASKPDPKSSAITSFMSGTVVSPGLMQVVREELDDLAAHLQREFGCGTGKIHTNCKLPKLIAELKPGWSANAEKIDIVKFGQQVGQAARTIRELLLIDCQCAALNPPCPPCDDTAVLLARLDVEQCKVVAICNTVRQYVIAPTTIRYWNKIVAPAPARCCESDPKPRPPRPLPVPEVFPDEATTAAMHLRRADAMRATDAPLAEILGAPEFTLEDDIRDLRRRLAACEEQLAKHPPSKRKENS